MWKRIPTMFKLAKNVGGLEDRLTSIEKTLIHLKDALQNHEIQDDPLKVESEPDGLTASDMNRVDNRSPATVPREWCIENSYQQPVDRYIVRSSDDLSDRYHGPCTLYGLCNEFRDSILETQQYIIESGGENGRIKDNEILRLEKTQDILIEICSSSGIEEPFDLENDNMQILLPPKQFLAMACTSFFQQEDPALDLFCQSSFWQKVDEIYSNPLTSTDHVWALCFNNILLLVLGAEQFHTKGSIDHGLGSQFALPFISTIRCALACPKTLMRPKLINLQALVLLGVVAQKYLPPSFTEVLVAQACLLAKRMGLHQRCVTGEVTPVEKEERIKVFRLLYLKDKSLSLSLGITCWLPSFDCDMSTFFEKVPSTKPDISYRVELGRIQEDIYRIIYSPQSHRQSTSRRKIALSRIEKSLNHWLEAFAGSDSSLHTLPVETQLGFYSSRIFALRTSSDPRHKEQVVRDARIVCRLAVIADFPDDLDGIHVEDGRVNVASCLTSVSQSENGSTVIGPRVVPAAIRYQPKLHIRTVVEDFPLPAFFVLLRNIIWPILEDQRGDFQLLQAVSTLFENHDQKTQANNNTRRVLKAFQSLLAVTRVLRPELYTQQHQSPFPEQLPQVAVYFFSTIK
ncbi:hypothetical protein B7463_g4120, partial [Scytalidium lignicola]